MNRPAVFFDRDNTLIANDGYLGDPSGVALIGGAAPAIARARAMGFAVVTISNQSGVARGMFTEEAVHAVNSRMDEILLDQHPNARIDRHEFCPYHPQAVVERYKRDSDLRKPRPGMILQAAGRLNLDLGNSWVIGDAPRDIEAGKAAGCRTILFTDPSLKPSAATEESSATAPDFVATSLTQALDIIEHNKMSNPKIIPAVTTPDSTNDDAPETHAEPSPVPEEGLFEEAAAESVHSDAGAAKAMTFAERVKAGTFQPDRTVTAAGIATAERPRRAAAVAHARTSAASESAVGNASVPVARHVIAGEPSPRPTEPVSDTELLEPLLQQILEEVRLMRQQHPGTEFAVSKLLAGIVQVLVLPALFFAYLDRGTAGDLQSMLLLATFLETLTIALLIMGRQQ